ncbi:MAG TPA: ornithine cyclodeaminase family protein [Gemmatimonadaceae bacterium]|nr:ornithine cyclodeaminase family protein [Gemmatimonadaceae bacterium]
MATTLLLGKDDLRSLVEAVGLDRLMDLSIEHIEQLLHSQGSDALEIPARQGFVDVSGETSVMEWMPILRRRHHTLIKHVGYHPSNPAVRDLPTILSVLALFDEASGHMRTICDGTFLTAIRTGAASAVASRVLALPESRTLGLVGCGAQAVTQLHALTRVFPLDTILYFDRDPETQASFPHRAARFAVELQAAGPDEIAQRSDIICTVTSVAAHAGPVIALTDCADWLHVNAVGSDLPGKTELPVAFLRGGLVVPDFTPQAAREGESQQLEPAQIGPELHEIVKHPNRYQAWRHRHTVFDSTGFALEDLAVLEVLEALAAEHGIGSDVEIEAIGSDPHDPYGFLNAPATGETFGRGLTTAFDPGAVARSGD